MNTRAKPRANLPDTFDGLKGLIADRYPEFRGQMKRIAEHAIENPNDMALKTVAQSWATSSRSTGTANLDLTNRVAMCCFPTGWTLCRHPHRESARS